MLKINDKDMYNIACRLAKMNATNIAFLSSPILEQLKKELKFDSLSLKLNVEDIETIGEVASLIDMRT